jgi:(p)ppGpp synthase/HD superfamily hydrolase
VTKKGVQLVTAWEAQLRDRAAPAKRPGLLSEKQFLDRMLVEIAAVVQEVAPISQVVGRVKTLESTVAKAKRYATEVGQIHDKVGIRVVVPSVEQCFVVLNELHNSMEALGTGYNDYINSPKPNGYRALHTNLLGVDKRTLEVQVRSKEMHACAETGPARHGLYKARQENSPGQNLVWLFNHVSQEKK